jgi:hypothetical protein
MATGYETACGDSGANDILERRALAGALGRASVKEPGNGCGVFAAYYVAALAMTAKAVREAR